MATNPPQTEIYTVQLADGSEVDIEGPAGANEQQLQAFLKASGQEFPAPANDAAPPAQQAPQQQEPADTAADQIANEVDAEHVDRSAIPAPADPGLGQVAVSTETKTVHSPWLQRHGAQLGRMIASGVSDADILDFLKENGAPDGELNIQQALEFRHTPDFRIWKQQNPKAPYPINDLMNVPLQGDEKAQAKLSASPTGSFVAGAGDTASIGLLRPVGELLDPEFGTKQDLAQANHPGDYLVGQIAGSALFPSKALATAKTAATAAFREALASGVAREEAKTIARQAARKALTVQAAKEGGAYNAIYSAAHEDGDLADRAQAGVAGAATGGALGALGAQAGNAVSERLRLQGDTPVTLTPQQEALQASQRMAERGTPVDMLPADAGGPMVKRLTGAAAQAPLSASPVINKAAAILEQAKVARDAVGARIGPVADAEAVGEAAAKGARNYITRSRNQIGRIYDMAGTMAGDTKLPLPNAKAILDEQIARLEAVPGGGAGLQEAKDLRAALEGDFTVQGVRDMRTEMFVAPEFRGTPVERRMRQIVDAAAKDIEQGLRDAGKGDAARAFAEADRRWRQRLNTISRVIEPIIGKSEDTAKSGEEIIAALQRAAKGNNQRLRSFISTLPEDEAGMVRAKFIDELGREAPGRQNAAGDAFSLSKFLTDWNKLGRSAKATLFDDEARAALDDLALMAERTKDSQKYANFSNTSGGIWGNLGLLGGVSAFSRTAAAAGLGAQLISGRLLASPKFARWLARAPKTALSDTAYIDRLSRIAAAEPAIANDVLGLQKRLLDTFSGSAPARLAADEPVNSATRIGEGQQGQENQQAQQELPQ